MRLPMHSLFRKVTAGNQGPPAMIAALVLAALVPAMGVLWFMSVAMRNERLDMIPIRPMMQINAPFEPLSSFSCEMRRTYALIEFARGEFARA